MVRVCGRLSKNGSVVSMAWEGVEGEAVSMEFSRGVRMIESGNWMRDVRSKCLISGRVSPNNL